MNLFLSNLSIFKNIAFDEYQLYTLFRRRQSLKHEILSDNCLLNEYQPL
jgi:hypothetical protein